MPDRAGGSWDQFSPEALAAMAQAGDGGAMEALWERFRPLVLHLLARYVGQAIAEELPGALYMAFHDLILRYDPGRGVMLAGYLKSVLPQELKAAAEHARGGVRSGFPAQGAEDGGAASGDPFNEQGNGEDRAAPGDMERDVLRRLMLQRLLARLQARERYVVWQHAVEGWTHREIGMAISISEADARVLHYRTRTKLRRWCEKNPDDAV